MANKAPRINMSDMSSTFSEAGSMFDNLGRTTNRFAEVVRPQFASALRVSRGDVKKAPRFNSGVMGMAPRFTGNTAQRAGSAMGQQTQSATRLMTHQPTYNIRMLDPLGIYKNQSTTAPGGSVAGGTGPTNTGFPQLDAHNAELASASARFGVPVNVLKVFLNNESSGDWNRDGNRLWNGRPGMGPLLPFVGIFDTTWKSWGCPGDVRSALGNKQAQIDCMAKGVSDWYRRAQAEGYGWGEVFTMYFSGHYVPNGWADENGMTDFRYRDNAMALLNKLNAADPGVANAGSSGGSAGGSISTIWGGSGSPDISYGWNARGGPALYGYGRDYGMDGSGHTGVDIPLPLNSPAYSATSGVVECACNGSGPGCVSFSDDRGGGCGQIRIRLDNGDLLIYGHMSTATIRVGQRINAGQQVGTVGSCCDSAGGGGPHIHLEYRTRDASTNSGWRIVDPVAYLGGAAAAPQPSQQQSQQQSSISPWLNQNGMVSPGNAPWSTGGSVYRPVSSWRY